ncbi:MAG: helix-turn-helix domain-containing protein [Nitrospira sp.]|nr:helix-turn-helix domain-containing protein [Nitrospira sp.]
MTLRELRHNRGWTQQYLAIKARSSTATISACELYNFAPRRADTRERLARALGVDPEILWSGADYEVGEASDGI